MLYRSVSRERDGTPWIPANALAAMRSAATRPVFGVTENLVTGGMGLIGGPTLSYANLGRVIANRTADILEGRRPEDLPTIVYDEWRWIYDWDQLQLHGVNPRRLRPGAEFVNRPIPFWRSYPVQTSVAGLLLLVQFLLIAALAQRSRLLQWARRDLQALSKRTLRAVDEERSRIASDLHDDLCQDLSLVAIEVGNLQGQHSLGIVQKVQDVIRRARAMARGLHPSYGPEGALEQALVSLGQRVQRLHGIAVHVKLNGDLGVVDDRIALTVHRIAQEALANVVQHAQAQRCHLRLLVSEARVQFEVEDDGVGLPVARERSTGLGLLSMRERARAVDGRLSLSAATPTGLCVSLLVPIARPTELTYDD